MFFFFSPLVSYEHVQFSKTDIKKRWEQKSERKPKFFVQYGRQKVEKLHVSYDCDFRLARFVYMYIQYFSAEMVCPRRKNFYFLPTRWESAYRNRCAAHVEILNKVIICVCGMQTFLYAFGRKLNRYVQLKQFFG